MSIKRSSNGVAALRRDRRKLPRKGALWLGKLVTTAGTFECRVLNLSPSGAKVELVQLVARGETVTLILEPLHEFIGVVAWGRDRCIGIEIKEHRMTTTRSRMNLPGSLTLP